MSLDWQAAVVVVCVAWAASVVLRRVYRLFREPGTSACGSKGCHACPSNGTSKPGELVQLDASVGGTSKIDIE